VTSPAAKAALRPGGLDEANPGRNFDCRAAGAFVLCVIRFVDFEALNGEEFHA